MLKLRRDDWLVLALLGWFAGSLFLSLFLLHDYLAPAFPSMEREVAVVGLVVVGLLSPALALGLARALRATSRADKMVLLVSLLGVEAAIATQVWLYVTAHPWADAVAATLTGALVVAGHFAHASELLRLLRGGTPPRRPTRR